MLADELYLSELNTDNPLGMSGKLARAFGALMKMMWSGEHVSVAPIQLKVCMSSLHY